MIFGLKIRQTKTIREKTYIIFINVIHADLFSACCHGKNMFFISIVVIFNLLKCSLSKTKRFKWKMQWKSLSKLIFLSFKNPIHFVLLSSHRYLQSSNFSAGINNVHLLCKMFCNRKMDNLQIAGAKSYLQNPTSLNFFKSSPTTPFKAIFNMRFCINAHVIIFEKLFSSLFS